MVKFSLLNILFLALGFLAAVIHLPYIGFPLFVLEESCFEKESQLQLSA